MGSFRKNDGQKDGSVATFRLSLQSPEDLAS
jgi:hypothetical protein